jgi:phosphatidylserine/phosphatidylglycerophosphate/cardiolipin synthase-like enzyme
VFRQQTNIHNKEIIVDGQTLLVSSANWSSDGVLRNREAGLCERSRNSAGIGSRNSAGGGSCG